MIYFDPKQMPPWQVGTLPSPALPWPSWPFVWQPRYPAAVNQPYAPAANRYAAPAKQAPAKQPAVPEKTGLKPEQFAARDLDQDSLDRIISKYGSDIDDIFPLSPGQKWMFGQAPKVTSAFFLQMVFKITMDLKPSTFRQKVDEVSLKRPNLRTAFAYRDMKKPYQVVLRNRRPELRFIDRSDKTMEDLQQELDEFCIADRRRGFDLENDPLLRITVFSTAEENTYAIVSSQPHINDDGASEMLVFKEIYVDYALGGKIKLPEIGIGSYRDYVKWMDGLDRESVYEYWENLLSGAPETHLPGRVCTSLEAEMNTLLLSFSPEEDSVIAKLPARYRATLNSIAQTAWGIMLQKIYHTKDVVFGSITSGRSAEVKDSNQITGGFVNAFPVRVQTDKDETFAALVKRVQLQILHSQEMAHLSPDEMQERLGRKTPIFDHLLNFHNFAGSAPKTLPPLPGFTILGIDTYDNLSTGFCLYFQLREGKLHCLFSYDRHMFSERKIRQLMNCYRRVFQQILKDEDQSLSVEQIRCPDIVSFISANRDDIEEQERIRSFLKSLPLFEGLDEAGLKSLAKDVIIQHHTGNDVILRERSAAKGLDIVMEGFVETFRTAKNGWDSPMMILRPGRILTAAGVLEHMPVYFGARAASDEVTVLHIPMASCLRFIDTNPRLALNLLREEEELVQRFSYVWINADT